MRFYTPELEHGFQLYSSNESLYETNKEFSQERPLSPNLAEPSSVPLDRIEEEAEPEESLA